MIGCFFGTRQLFGVENIILYVSHLAHYGDNVMELFGNRKQLNLPSFLRLVLYPNSAMGNQCKLVPREGHHN